MSKARDLANAGTALTTVSATELGYLDGVTSNVQNQIDTKDSLPSRSGQSGKYLTNDGTNASWGTVSQYALPTQTGNAGKFLTTNGTSESWASTTPDYTNSSFFQKISQYADDGSTNATTSSYEDVVAVLKDSSGNFFVVLKTYWTAGSQQSIMVILKKSPTGVTIWQKAYVTNNSYGSTGIETEAAFLDSSNNILWFGEGWNGSSSGQLHRGYAMKINGSDGSINWQKFISTGTDDYFRNCHLDSSGAIIGVGGGYSGSTPFSMLCKLDNAGTFQWAKKLNNPSTAYSAQWTDVTTDSSNNVYAAGYEGNGTTGYDIQVVKWDSSGNQQWSYKWTSTTGITSDEARRITSDGTNIYVTVSYPSSLSAILKIDSSGNIVWSKTFASGYYNIEYSATTGYIYALGNSDLTVGPGSIPRAVVAKIDTSGNLISQWGLQMHPRQSTSMKTIVDDGTTMYIGGVAPNSSSSDGLFAKLKTDLSEFNQFTVNSALIDYKNYGLTLANGPSFTRSAGTNSISWAPSNSTDTKVVAYDGWLASTNLYI